jgi:phospholipase/carboxylesterase
MPAARSNSTVLLHQNNILRVSLPKTPTNKLCLMLHGWNGDENSMQVFFSDIPENTAIIAPRAFHSTRETGYTWIPSYTQWSQIKTGTDIPVQELLLSSIQLIDLIPTWTKFLGLTINDIVLMGFSQGAALAFILGLSAPDMFSNIVSLSGFLPDAADQHMTMENIKNKRIFIAHGTLDDVVPIQKARDSASELSHYGAKVSYCEDKTGHKIGLSCRKQIKQFLQ